MQDKDEKKVGMSLRDGREIISQYPEFGYRLLQCGRCVAPDGSQGYVLMAYHKTPGKNHPSEGDKIGTYRVAEEAMEAIDFIATKKPTPKKAPTEEEKRALLRAKSFKLREVSPEEGKALLEGKPELKKPEPKPEPKPKPKPKQAHEHLLRGLYINLKTAVEQYLQHQTDAGQKPSTIGTIKRSLDLLVGDLGEDKEVGKILAVHIAGFFKSEAATMQPGKDGPKPRAEASILQIRRIVRAALVWWHQQGYLKAVPLPADEKKYLEPRKGRKAKAAEATEPAPEAPVAVEPEPKKPEPKPMPKPEPRTRKTYEHLVRGSYGKMDPEEVGESFRRIRLAFPSLTGTLDIRRSNENPDEVWVWYRTSPIVQVKSTTEAWAIYRLVRAVCNACRTCRGVARVVSEDTMRGILRDAGYAVAVNTTPDPVAVEPTPEPAPEAPVAVEPEPKADEVKGDPTREFLDFLTKSGVREFSVKLG